MTPTREQIFRGNIKQQKINHYETPIFFYYPTGDVGIGICR
jgi:hypothetical protein